MRSEPLSSPSLALVLVLSLSVTSALALLGCEEEQVNTQRGVRRPAASRATSQRSAQLTAYTTPGAGPQESPDWIKSLDPNMMRRSQKELEGFRYGHPFNPSALIERGESGWRLVLTEQPLASPSELIHQGQVVELPLKGEPTAQFQQSGQFETSEVSWRLPKSETPSDTKLWPAKSAYLLELIKWEVSPYSPKGGAFQQAGRASGRLMLRTRDEQGVEGWVVGRFDDVLVRYVGDPSAWEKAR